MISYSYSLQKRKPLLQNMIMRRTICGVIWANLPGVISVNTAHFPGPNCFLSTHQFTGSGSELIVNFLNCSGAFTRACRHRPSARRDGSRGLRPDIQGQTSLILYSWRRFASMSWGFIKFYTSLDPILSVESPSALESFPSLLKIWKRSLKIFFFVLVMTRGTSPQKVGIKTC